MIAIIVLLAFGMHLVFGWVQGPLWFLCSAVSLVHAGEEANGELWKYFGKVTRNRWVRDLEYDGLLFIVAPALALQQYAAYRAFSGDSLDVFWLAVVIGAQVGDAVFSHLQPSAAGHGLSPGQSSAVVYLVAGLVLAILFHVPLMTFPKWAWTGAAVGAGFFASVLPALRLTRTWFGFEELKEGEL